MIVLGLTGSIGMGKTTTGAMFADAGAVVYDADLAVHALYAPAGAAIEPVGRAFPGVVDANGVNRARLSDALRADPAALARLEAIVHPLVGRHRSQALERAQLEGAKLVVLDVPLLFETGSDRLVDAVVVVTAPPTVQRARVLARSGMDDEKLRLLLLRQLSDADKRARADFIVETGQGMAAAQAGVRRVLAAVLDPSWRAPRAKL